MGEKEIDEGGADGTGELGRPVERKAEIDGERVLNRTDQVAMLQATISNLFEATR